MKSVIIGAGTYGEVYLSYLRDAGVDVAGFLDDNEKLHGAIIRGVPVLGSTDLLYSLKQTDGIDSVYCPIGNNRLRVKFLSLAMSLGYKTPCYIHPSVEMSSNVLLGNGVYVLLGTHIMPYVNIKDFGGVGDGQTINTQAFKKAISALEKLGGGHLVVPEGIWMTGMISLKDII